MPTKPYADLHPIAFQRTQQNRQAGNLTPRTLNSLSAIAAEHGQEGDEEEWEQEQSFIQRVKYLLGRGDDYNDENRVLIGQIPTANGMANGLANGTSG